MTQREQTKKVSEGAGSCQTHLHQWSDPPEADGKSDRVKNERSSPDEDNTTGNLNQGMEEETFGGSLSLTDATRSYLNEREMAILASEDEEFVQWMIERGKHPNKGTGLSMDTVENYYFRLDHVRRRVWEENKVSTVLSHSAASEYVARLAADEYVQSGGEAYSETSKRKDMDSLRKYFEFLHHVRGDDMWEPPLKFEDDEGTPPDTFSKGEYRRLHQAALTVGSIPHYNSLDSNERDKWKVILSQRLGKPKEEVSRADWRLVNTSWELPALLWTSFDIGPRAGLISNFDMDWVKLGKGTIQIPKEGSPKTENYREAKIRTQTQKILRKWKEERAHRPKYRGRDAIVLNREGNRYRSNSLNPLLRKVCHEAGIDTEVRKIQWGSIRRTVGTHLTEEGNIAQANKQLGHESLESTLRYVEPSDEAIEDSLNKFQ